MQTSLLYYNMTGLHPQIKQILQKLLLLIHCRKGEYLFEIIPLIRLVKTLCCLLFFLPVDQTVDRWNNKQCQ
jgi:hypothetical protein